jgi:hypothetical protein
MALGSLVAELATIALIDVSRIVGNGIGTYDTATNTVFQV